jgi:hypothetical protein
MIALLMFLAAGNNNFCLVQDNGYTQCVYYTLSDCQASATYQGNGSYCVQNTRKN